MFIPKIEDLKVYLDVLKSKDCKSYHPILYRSEQIKELDGLLEEGLTRLNMSVAYKINENNIASSNSNYVTTLNQIGRLFERMQQKLHNIHDTLESNREDLNLDNVNVKLNEERRLKEELERIESEVIGGIYQQFKLMKNQTPIYDDVKIPLTVFTDNYPTPKYTLDFIRLFKTSTFSPNIIKLMENLTSVIARNFNTRNRQVLHPRLKAIISRAYSQNKFDGRVFAPFILLEYGEALLRD